MSTVQGALGLRELMTAVQGARGLLMLEEGLTWTVLQLGLLSILPLRFRASPGQIGKGRKRRLH